MTLRIPVGVFFALFTASGFAGLIYESIWSHYLKLFLGHAAYAQTLVLAIFMGGMALGAWLVSRYTHRIANLLLGYAVAELGIGLLALSFNATFRAATGWAFESVLPALGGSGAVDLFKWSLASVLILPASVLLGTTFPLMSAGVLRAYPEASARALAMLYFTNSFGAALGVLASGLVLVDRLGLPGTILTAGVLNVLLALAVWTLARKAGAAGVGSERVEAAAPSGPSSLGRVILLLAAVTGAASFIYEVTWIRMLSTGLGSSTHSFEVMLAAFILGMAAGAGWLRNRIGHLRSDIGWLAALLVAKAALAVGSLWVYGEVLGFLQWMLQAVARTDAGYALMTSAGLVASMLVMFPTAFCAGMTLPLATHALTSRGHGEASIGRVYAANTAGCIVGASFATHVGMEALGVKGLTGLGALLDSAVAAGLLAVAAGAAWRARALAATGAAFVVGAVGFFAAQLDLLRMSSGVFRYGLFDDPRTSKVLFYRDGKTATISVVDQHGKRSIRTNGKSDASLEVREGELASIDEHTMTLAGALPIALKPDARLVANIGFGSGLTTHTLLGSPHVAEVDSIEIERMMIEGAKLFAPRNRRAFEDARSRIHIEDAKTFFAARGRRYDVIVSEPSNPWVSGVSTLFSEEFYAQVRRYLKDDGLLVQWVHVYDMNVGLVSTILQALGRHFGDYAIYNSGVGDVFVIATPGRALPPLRADVTAMPAIGEDLRLLGYRGLADLESLRVAGRRTLEPLLLRTGFPANSDFFPVLDQRAPRARFKAESAEDLPRLRDGGVPVLALLEGERRTPLARLQQLGTNRPTRITHAVAAGEAIGVFLSGAGRYAVTLPGADRAQALLAHSLLENCADAQAAWLEAVSRVAMLSMPYLEKAAVDPMFERIRTSKCARGLSETGKRRLALLEAINARDAEAMRTHSLALLQDMRPEMEPERDDYLVALLASSLATGRTTEARAMAARYLPGLSRRDQESLRVRLLAARLEGADRR
jgi:spermidine synthase